MRDAAPACAEYPGKAARRGAEQPRRDSGGGGSSPQLCGIPAGAWKTDADPLAAPRWASDGAGACYLSNRPVISSLTEPWLSLGSLSWIRTLSGPDSSGINSWPKPM